MSAGVRRPRLVATDLDGTLLDAEGRVSERTRTVLSTLDESGVPVVFVTGRPLRWMSDLWDDVGGHGLAICSNGALVYDVTNRRVRSTSPIDAALLLRVADQLREALPGTTYALETTEGFALEPDFPTAGDRGDAHAHVRVAPLAEHDGAPVVKLLALSLDADPERYWREVQDIVGEELTVTWSSSRALAEISAAGITKASALATLCEELGVDAADVVAFGDMPNDVAMLEWAGRSYAMAEAHPTVREVADDVAPSHADDGVARVLTRLFDLAHLG